MPTPSEGDARRELRRQVLGFGDFSGQKSYFPVLSQQVDELHALRAALDAVSDGILWLTWPAMRIREANAAGRGLLSLGPVEGDAGWALPEALAEALAGQEQGAAGGLVAIPVRGSDGVLRELEAALGQPTGAEGDVRVVILRDVTSELEAQRAVQRSEARLAAILGAIPDVVYSLDSRGFLTFVSEAVRRYGYAPQELVGQHFLGLVAEEDHPAARRFADVPPDADSAPDTVRLRFRGPDGALRVFDAHHQPLFRSEEAGADFEIHGVVRDATALVAAEAALRESEERYRTLFEAESDAIVVIDVESLRNIDANQGAVDLYGYTRQELLEWTAPDLSAEPEETQTQTQTRDGLVRIPLRYHRKSDGTVFPVEIAARFFELGGRRCLLAAMRDISERLAAEEEREALEAQLLQSQKMESVGRLAGGVAHDFNNMLQVILGHVHLAAVRVAPADPLRQHLEEIDRAAERSANLTRQLLAFARKQAVSPTVLDLGEAVASTRAMLARLIGEEIEFVWDLAADLWHVRIDPTQVDQVVANLVVNARDAIAGPGMIRIGTRNQRVGHVDGTAPEGAAPGDYVVLSVSDTGTGMDAETLSRIFEPFFTTKGLGKGTGLGLAMVYGIVRQNGGFTEVDSTVGQGTTFRIYLPRASSRPHPEPEDSLDAPPAGGTETVMVVEDEEAILALGRAILEQRGYRVLAAASPHEALDLATAHAGVIDLLLTDVVMPGMGGLELAERLTRLRPTLRCLFMSGYPDRMAGPQGRIAAGVNYLQKPFSVSDLLAKVREVLDAGS